MSEERINYLRRLSEFDGPIAKIGRHSPIVQRIMRAYADAEIITKEEALSRMVVELATDGDATKREYINLAMRGTFPPIMIPKL